MIKWTNVSKRAPVTAVIIITVTIIQRKSGTIIRWKSENRHFRRDLGWAKAWQLSLLLLQNLVKDLCKRGSTAQCVLSHVSHVWLFVTPWTVVPQAPQSMRFSRQEYWSGLPFPSHPQHRLENKSCFMECSPKIYLITHQPDPYKAHGRSLVNHHKFKVPFTRLLLWWRRR